MRSEQVGAVGMTELQDSFCNPSLALNMLMQSAAHMMPVISHSQVQVFPHMHFPKHLLCNLDLPIAYCYTQPSRKD